MKGVLIDPKGVFLLNKRKKNPPIRDDFTDALNEELQTRKIFERAKPDNSDDIFLSEVKTEISIQAVEEKPKPKKSRPKKKSVKKPVEVTPLPQEKISPPKLEKLPPFSVSEVKAENKLEERIFKEAENDFFDEKPMFENETNMRSNVSSGESRRLAYHSTYFQEVDDEVEIEKPDKKIEEPYRYDPRLGKKLSRAEMSGVALSGFMLLYSISNLDKPLFFVSLSLFSFLIRPLIGSFCGRYNQAVQNALHSFSIVLFIGSLILLWQSG